jgi:hypothetical protein
MVARMSQMTPLQTKNMSVDPNHHRWTRESPRANLIPKEEPDPKSANALTLQAEQSNEHSQKHDDVGNKGYSDVEFVTLGIRHNAGLHIRVPCGACLQGNKL